MQLNIISKVKLAKPLKVVIDAGNGTAGAFAPQSYEISDVKSQNFIANLMGISLITKPTPRSMKT